MIHLSHTRSRMYPKRGELTDHHFQSKGRRRTRAPPDPISERGEDGGGAASYQSFQPSMAFSPSIGKLRRRVAGNGVFRLPDSRSFLSRVSKDRLRISNDLTCAGPGLILAESYTRGSRPVTLETKINARRICPLSFASSLFFLIVHVEAGRGRSTTPDQSVRRAMMPDGMRSDSASHEFGHVRYRPTNYRVSQGVSCSRGNLTLSLYCVTCAPLRWMVHTW